MALTGHPTGRPLGPPRPLVGRLKAIGLALQTSAASLGAELNLDVLSMLGERAAISGLSRGGTISCGGKTRLFETATGWMAVTLARPADTELVPAWLATTDSSAENPWKVVATAIKKKSISDLTDRAALVGLPVAALPSDPPDSDQAADFSLGTQLPCRTAQFGSAPAITSLDGVLVADLSSLWAGPLCGSLLSAAGATVVKVESMSRPDGTREGPRAFLDLMNGGKLSFGLDFGRRCDLGALVSLLEAADVVVEASRPRALDQMGIDPVSLLQRGGPKVWVSITGYGRTGTPANKPAYGDDAAVAGGLVTWSGSQPYFCADAIADPLSGATAAAACLAALVKGGRWFVDVAMSRVAAHFAGPTIATTADVTVAAPRSRPPTAKAPNLGQHNNIVHDLVEGRRRG